MTIASQQTHPVRQTALGVFAACVVATSCGRSAGGVALGQGDPHGGTETTTGGRTSGGGNGATSGDGGSDTNGGAGGDGTAGAVSAGSGGGPPIVPGQGIPLQLNGNPLHSRFPALTHDQWENSVRDNLGRDAPTGFVDTLTERPALGPYPNDELFLYVDRTLVADYQRAAEGVAAALRADPAALAAAFDGTDPEGFVAAMGRRFYRRPLTADEVQSYLSIFETGASFEGETGAFASGASLVVEVMLQSPHFLYRVDRAAAGEAVDDYQLATNLAYFATNTTPSDALLDAAERGVLTETDSLAAAATELLESVDAVGAMRLFHGSTFSLGRIRNAAKADLGDVENALYDELEEAAYRFFDALFTGDQGLRDLLLTDVGYVGPELAELYGAAPPASGELEAMSLGEDRVGFFSQVPWLFLHGNNAIPDSIHRGIDLNIRVLCVSLPAPSIVALPTIPPVQPGTTNRERVTATTSGCGDPCHAVYIDPLGFAFEGFDGLGRVRDTDNGIPVDTAASYPFVEGTHPFAGPRDLMQLFAEGVQAHDCYGAHLAQYGLARQLTPDDRALLDTLRDAGQRDDASIRDLILALVTSSTFRTRTGDVP